MAAGSPNLLYRVSPHDVESIISHKHINAREHYLVRWRSKKPTTAVLSWHNISELAACMHLLQDYVNVVQHRSKPSNLNGMLLPTNRKRKSPHDEALSAAPTPGSSSSVTDESFDNQFAKREVYNGVLLRRSGWVKAKESSSPGVIRVNATQMPDAAMLQVAKSTSIFNAEVQIRNTFLRQLSSLPGPKVNFVNILGSDTPSLHFKWIDDYVLGEGVERVDEIIVGCLKCKPDMGGGKGCEYTQMCDCLELAAPDGSEAGLRKMDDEQRAIYDQWVNGEYADTSRLPKRFPYFSTGEYKGCLQSFYLNSRFVIYECNDKCRCGPKCKTRNVQLGRKVRLEIFKTERRGFGLRCTQPLKRGQFIDKYLGELITDAEADRREAATATDVDRASYLFWLDKHMVDDDQPGLHQEDCFVADGEAMGGPTRFINHSCDPNVRLFTVSYNKFDERIYDLAFFALDDIPAGEELTFDYVDPEPDEDENVAAENQRKKHEQMMAEGRKRVTCLCGAVNCRGFMWDKS